MNRRLTSTRTVKAPIGPRVPNTCNHCGTELADYRAKLCGSCWVPERARLAADRARRGREARAATIAATGLAPSQTAAAQSTRAESLRRERALRDAWDREHAGEHYDREAFRREVLPGLAGVTVAAIVAATGVSESAASRVRRGLLLPHPRHWKNLNTLF